ncbi:MAG: crotonobetainyl-CoA:carnitine CoA-transferase CaiB-like acyl-CoA transferase, partial [Polyangiales bacterium]
TPMKAGVGIGDVMCGMYATVAILAALRHRDACGIGQHIDLALYDSTVSWLTNAATNHLVSGELPKRYGNAHPNIVPYQVFPTRDGHVVIAVGNDEQFRRLNEVMGCTFHEDPRFVTNSLRLEHRTVLVPLLEAVTLSRDTSTWISTLRKASVPCGPVNNLEEVFQDPQTQHREMQIEMEHAHGHVRLLGNPIKFSKTPVSYRRAPPTRGQHTDEILQELGITSSDRDDWRNSGIVE